MSLYALTVTTTDISQLQAGILFTTTNAGDISNQVSSINAPGSTVTVNSYANSLLGSVQATSQVAMGVSALMTGQSQTVAVLTNLVTNPAIIPSFVSFALANKLDATQVVGEDVGLAFAGNASFVANFGGLSLAAFTQQQLALTGINQAFTASQVQFFINLYTANGLPGNATPTAAQIQAAAYGVVFGLNVAQNLEGTGSSAATIQLQVKNALFDIAQTASSPPGSAYVPGAPLAAQPVPFPFQGATNVTTNVTLTVTQDTVVLTQSNSVVTGTFGGAGATWTVGDTITAAAGTTGQTFNINGTGPIGNINVTPANFTTNKVSGVATLNVNANTVVGAVNSESVTGNFTAGINGGPAGPMGDWVGLTQLNVNSGSSVIGGTDNLTADVTTKVLVTDTAIAVGAGQSMIVNGSLTTTINETNVGLNAGAILVNGGVGTTTVSVTQTETAPGSDAFVKITDANSGVGSAAAGTIATVTLNGLSHPVAATFTSPGAGLVITGTILNTITDNALATLTINNSDALGAAVSIIDNLTPATATTLALNLSADGVVGGFAVPVAGFPWSSLILADTHNEISTIHLTLGAQNSSLQLVDNGLVTLDTPNPGTGALVGFLAGGVFGGFSSITDTVAAAVSFNLSGLNGPNNIDVERGATVNSDVYTLGNFGTNNAGLTPFTTAQHLIIETGVINSTNTVNFGSGAYLITEPNGVAHATDTYVNTAANGAGLANLFAAPFAQQWAVISNALAGDVISFKGDTVQILANLAPQLSVQNGINASLTTAAHTATSFQFAGNTYFFDHADGSGILSAADAMIEVTGLHAINLASLNPGSHTFAII